MLKNLRNHFRSQEGATAVEYGIMVALIAVVIIAAVATLGGTLNTTFEGVNECLETDGAEGCEDGE